MKTYQWMLCMLLCALSVASCSKEEEDDANVIDSAPWHPVYVRLTNGATFTICSSKTLFGGDENGVKYDRINIPNEGGEFSMTGFPESHMFKYYIMPNAPVQASDGEIYNDSASYNVEPYVGEYFSTSVSPDGRTITLLIDENSTSAERSFWMFVSLYDPSKPFAIDSCEMLCVTQSRK